MRTQGTGVTVWRQFRKNRWAFAALLFVCVMAAAALLAPVIANDKPLLLKDDGKWHLPVFHKSPKFAGTDFLELKKGSGNLVIMPAIPYGTGSYDLNAILAPPSLSHILGTDGDGRDVAAQMVWGARVSLSVGVMAVGLAAVIGIFLGALAGFYGGWVDLVISRFIEVMICFPAFFLILTVLAFVGPSIYNVMAVIGLTSWTGIARLVRGECLKLKRREFVVAAVAAGARDRRIILHHLLPAALAPVLVSVSFGVASAILVESALSFLGFGVPPASPSWGSVLSQAQRFMDFAWWLTLAPGSAIFLTITAFNLIGEAVRDAYDPNS